MFFVKAKVYTVVALMLCASYICNNHSDPTFREWYGYLLTIGSVLTLEWIMRCAYRGARIATLREIANRYDPALQPSLGSEAPQRYVRAR